MVGREVKAAMLLDQGRQNKLRAHYSSDTKGGSEIVVVVAQLNVIAKVGNVVAHKAFDRLAFGAHLKRACRIGGDGHVEVGHSEEREGGSAGAEFN